MIWTRTEMPGHRCWRSCELMLLLPLRQNVKLTRQPWCGCRLGVLEQLSRRSLVALGSLLGLVPCSCCSCCGACGEVLLARHDRAAAAVPLPQQAADAHQSREVCGQEQERAPSAPHRRRLRASDETVRRWCEVHLPQEGAHSCHHCAMHGALQLQWAGCRERTCTARLLLQHIMPGARVSECCVTHL